MTEAAFGNVGVCDRPDCDHPSHDVREMTLINGIRVCSDTKCIEWGMQTIASPIKHLRALLRETS